MWAQLRGDGRRRIDRFVERGGLFSRRFGRWRFGVSSLCGFLIDGWRVSIGWRFGRLYDLGLNGAAANSAARFVERRWEHHLGQILAGLEDVDLRAANPEQRVIAEGQAHQAAERSSSTACERATSSDVGYLTAAKSSSIHQASNRQRRRRREQLRRHLVLRLSGRARSESVLEIGQQLIHALGIVHAGPLLSASSGESSSKSSLNWNSSMPPAVRSTVALFDAAGDFGCGSSIGISSLSELSRAGISASVLAERNQASMRCAAASGVSTG